MQLTRYSPKRNQSAARKARFNCLVTFRTDDTSGNTWENVSGLVGLKCAYRAGQGGAPGPYQAQAPQEDTLLVLGWYPTIVARQQALVTLPDGTELEFAVTDAAQGDSGQTTTLVTLYGGHA